MPDAARKSPEIVYGLSIWSITTMFCTAQRDITKNTKTKNTRFASVRLLMPDPPRRRRASAWRHRARDEPRVHLREVARDALRDLVHEPVDPLEEGAHLGSALRHLVDDGVELFHLPVD